MPVVKFQKSLSQLLMNFNQLGEIEHDQKITTLIQSETEKVNMCTDRHSSCLVLDAFKEHFKTNQPSYFFERSDPCTHVSVLKSQGYASQRIESREQTDSKEMLIGTQLTYHFDSKRKFDPCQRLLQEAEKPSLVNGFDTPWNEIGSMGVYHKNTWLPEGREGFEGKKWKFEKFASQFEDRRPYVQDLLNKDFFETIENLMVDRLWCEQAKGAEIINALKPWMEIVHDHKDHHHGMFMIMTSEAALKAALSTGSLALPNSQGDILEVSHYYSVTVNRY